jgi:divalent metal cation (Fe/Co/Zn/Cd) transporter
MDIDSSPRLPMLRTAIALEYFSLVWMTAEGGVSFLAGLAARSLSLEVFGLDSLIEIISAGVVLWRMRLERTQGRRPDADGRVEAAERRAAYVVAACLLALAVYIVIGVTQSLLSRAVPAPGLWGFVVAISAIIVMPWLWKRKQRVGQALDSPSLEEDGVGNLTCGWMAFILLLGLAAARLGWWWADPTASLALGVFVAREGWEAWGHARGSKDGE